MPTWTTDPPTEPGLYWTNKGKGIHQLKRFYMYLDTPYCEELPWYVHVQGGMKRWPVKIEEPSDES